MLVVAQFLFSEQFESDARYCSVAPPATWIVAV